VGTVWERCGKGGKGGKIFLKYIVRWIVLILNMAAW